MLEDDAGDSDDDLSMDDDDGALRLVPMTVLVRDFCLSSGCGSGSLTSSDRGSTVPSGVGVLPLEIDESFALELEPSLIKDVPSVIRDGELEGSMDIFGSDDVVDDALKSVDRRDTSEGSELFFDF